MRDRSTFLTVSELRGMGSLAGTMQTWLKIRATDDTIVEGWDEPKLWDKLNAHGGPKDVLIEETRERVTIGERLTTWFQSPKTQEQLKTLTEKYISAEEIPMAPVKAGMSPATKNMLMIGGLAAAVGIGLFVFLKK